MLHERADLDGPAFRLSRGARDLALVRAMIRNWKQVGASHATTGQPASWLASCRERQIKSAPYLTGKDARVRHIVRKHHKGVHAECSHTTSAC